MKLPTIFEAAQSIKELSTFVTAVKAAGLVDTLNGTYGTITYEGFEGPYTVFAPNNDAFEKMPDWLLKPEHVEDLRFTLLRHVIDGPSLDFASMLEGETIFKTAGGEYIGVDKEDGIWRWIRIASREGKATVTKAEVLASNGVIHIVDSVF